MATPNPYQNVAVIDNNATIKATIDARLALGYVIQHMINLAPVQNKILIIYVVPPDPEPIP